VANSTDFPIAWDEASRLEAVHALRLLDTPPEERFDRVTRIAKDMFHVPMALINLVDANRQWSKSRQGLDTPEVPRVLSFCSHAILQDDVFMVEDACDDQRFADNPLVAGAPNIRFYAGQPLYSVDGKKVGTLCLLDTVARQLTVDQKDKLRSLGAWAEREVNAYITDTDAMRRWENKLRLAHVLEHATEGVLSVSLEGVIETANPAACQIFRFTATELIGRPIRDLIPQSEHALHESYMERLRGEEGQHLRTAVEATGVRKDGEAFPAEVSFRKIRIGNQSFFTGIVRDISERKNVEQARSGFISSVSHELRTPLTSIVGALGILKEEEIGLNAAETSELLDIAYLNSQRLHALINDILDIEKLDAGMMPFVGETLPVQNLIQEACRLNGPFARKLDIVLEIQVPDEPAHICVDRARCGQVLTNLISNACKFSPAGATVTIAAEVKASDGFVRISVRDQGPGVADEFRTRIFQRFAQGPSERKSKNDGTGLGLSLSKSMVEKMGGRIGYDSVAGHGATFFIDFPAVETSVTSSLHQSGNA
jgi:PAS domain S-box-containing protein